MSIRVSIFRSRYMHDRLKQQSTLVESSVEEFDRPSLTIWQSYRSSRPPSLAVTRESGLDEA